MKFGEVSTKRLQCIRNTKAKQNCPNSITKTTRVSLIEYSIFRIAQITKGDHTVDGKCVWCDGGQSSQVHILGVLVAHKNAHCPLWRSS